MDVHLLRAERQRIADLLRSTLTHLAILRAQRIGAATAEARQQLQSIIDAQSAVPPVLASGCSPRTHRSSRCRAGRLANDAALWELAPLDF